jgi:hypothetical protein
MMRGLLRGIAGLNGVFQIVLGVLCTIAPEGAGKAFELAQSGASVSALTRMFGGLLFGSGLLSAFVARDPDRNPDLLVLLVAACVVNVSADAMVVAHGEMPFASLAGGILLQVVLVVLALGVMRARGARGR